MKGIEDLAVKIFADGASIPDILALAREPYVRGFTTNPTLMRRAGVTNYREFAHAVLRAVPTHPISFEVFADAFSEMERQAREIASWGANVYVKVPVTDTSGRPTRPIVERLSRDGVKVNVTALTTLDQVRDVSMWVANGAPSYLSLFAGRVADTGRDPVPLMRDALEMIRIAPAAELIWASPREVLNIFQADDIGCHIITVTHDLLKKVSLVGKDLGEYSLETVRMFHDDALRAGFVL